MDTVSYSRNDVVQILNEKLVSSRINPETPHLFKTYAIQVTPVQLIIGNDGFERQRSTGYLSGLELMAFLLLGLGKYYFDNGSLDEAKFARYRPAGSWNVCRRSRGELWSFE